MIPQFVCGSHGDGSENKTIDDLCCTFILFNFLMSYCLLCPVTVEYMYEQKKPIQGDLVDGYRFISWTARSWIRIFAWPHILSVIQWPTHSIMTKYLAAA